MSLYKTFLIDLEHYEFCRFAATQLGYSSPNNFLALLLSTVLPVDEGGSLTIGTAIAVLNNAPCPHEDHVLDAGYVRIKLPIPAGIWLLAQKQYLDYAHFDALDFLQGLLNMALLTAINDFDRNTSRRKPVNWRPLWLQDWMHETAKRIENLDDSYDPDEDIPY